MTRLSSLLLLIVLAIFLVWSNSAHSQPANVTERARAKLRANASPSSAVIALLPAGTPVETLETSEEYVRVAIGEKAGWVAKSLLSIKEAKSEAPRQAKLETQLHEAKTRHSQAQSELAKIREEQEKNIWQALAATLGLAVASFIGGFWLRSVLFMRRYGWLIPEYRYSAWKKRIFT